MNCQQVNELADFYAFGGLEDQERRAVEAHLAEPGSHTCSEAIERAQEVADALLVLPEPRVPGTKTRREIEQHLLEYAEAHGGKATGEAREAGEARARDAREARRPMGAGAAARRTAARRWSSRVVTASGWLAAAGLLVAVIAVWRGQTGDDGDNYSHVDTGEPRTSGTSPVAAELLRELDAMAWMQGQPGARVATLAAADGSGAEGRAVVSPEGDRGTVLVHGVNVSTGESLVSWLVRGGGTPAYAGRLRPYGHAGAIGALDAAALAAGDVDVLLVSRERGAAGAAPTQVVLTGTFRTHALP